MVNLEWYQTAPRRPAGDLRRGGPGSHWPTATNSIQRARGRSSRGSARTSRSSVPLPPFVPQMRERTKPVYDFFVDRGDYTWTDINAASAAVEEPAVRSEMKRLEGILVRALEITFGICFLVMFALIVTQVALRYGFNESIGGANELATILFAYTSALGIAVGIAKRDHMAISWFTERFGLRHHGRSSMSSVWFCWR